MREFLPALVGNASLRRRVGEDLAAGGFSHAYILEGPEGSGKHTLALEIARALACARRTDANAPLPCGQCPACRKIAAGNCPDVLFVSRPAGKATTGVDTVRALRASVDVAPNELDVKIYIVEDAHTMTVQAQNALLLTLEEPPPFVVFLLLCTEAGALLETIRSRAPTWRLQPASEDEIAAYLQSSERPATARAARALQEKDPGEFAALLRMANGRIGRALSLLEEKQRAPMLARRADAQTLCELLANGRKNDTVMQLLLSFGTARDELVERLTVVDEALRDLSVLARCEQAPMLFFTDREEAAELSARFTERRLLDLIRATDDTIAALVANANARLAITQYLCRLTA